MDYDRLIGVPDFRLTGEQALIRDEIAQFVEHGIKTLDLPSIEWDPDSVERIALELVETADSNFELLQVPVPEEYDGLEAPLLTRAVIAEEIAIGDRGVATMISQHWKAVQLLEYIADGDARAHGFETILQQTGRLIGVPPTIGTGDLGSIHASGDEALSTERDGDQWILHGTEPYIWNSDIAAAYLVLARADVDAGSDGAYRAFLVPENAPGVDTAGTTELITQRLAMIGALQCNEVRLDEKHALGVIEETDDGYQRILQENSIISAATALGVARAAYAEALDYAHDRVQGGTEIINHEVIEEDFREMAVELSAAHSVLWTCADGLSAGIDYSWAETVGIAAYASRVASDVSTRSLEKFGGAGIMMDGMSPQKYWRDTMTGGSLSLQEL